MTDTPVTPTDDQLRTAQREMQMLCAFLETLLRSATAPAPKLTKLAEDARKFLRGLERIYFDRHPEARSNRGQQQFRLCAGMLATRNREAFGTDKNALTEEYSVEYNTPCLGSKTVTRRRLRPGAETPETATQVLQMTPTDPFFADLEDGMDEYAANLK